MMYNITKQQGISSTTTSKKAKIIFWSLQIKKIHNVKLSKRRNVTKIASTK